jgi:hypothetical protein
MDGEVGITRRRKPGKVNAQKPGKRPHKIDTEGGGDGRLKPLFNVITDREIGQVINIDANIEKGVASEDSPIEEAGFVGALSKTKGEEDVPKKGIPVAGATSEAV